MANHLQSRQEPVNRVIRDGVHRKGQENKIPITIALSQEGMIGWFGSLKKKKRLLKKHFKVTPHHLVSWSCS